MIYFQWCLTNNYFTFRHDQDLVKFYENYGNNWKQLGNIGMLSMVFFFNFQAISSWSWNTLVIIWELVFYFLFQHFKTSPDRDPYNQTCVIWFKLLIYALDCWWWALLQAKITAKMHPMIHLLIINFIDIHRFFLNLFN